MRERTLMLDKNLETGESLKLELEHDKQSKNHHWRTIFMSVNRLLALLLLYVHRTKRTGNSFGATCYSHKYTISYPSRKRKKK